MKRSAPDGGYDFGIKRQYRRNVWKTAHEHLQHRTSDKVAMLMPSSECDEIECALNKGFKQSNLIVCDKNRAIVAHIKRKYPQVKAYGVPLAVAVQRAVKDGFSVDVLNADLCGPIGPSLEETLLSISNSGLMKDNSMVFVTVLRGREQKGVLEKKHILTVLDVSKNGSETENTLVGGDAWRVLFIMHHLLGIPLSTYHSESHPDPYSGNYFGSIERLDIYRSTAGHQTMMWIATRLHKAPCFCNLCLSEYVATIAKKFCSGPEDLHIIKTFTKEHVKPHLAAEMIHRCLDCYGIERVSEAVRKFPHAYFYALSLLDQSFDDKVLLNNAPHFLRLIQKKAKKSSFFDNQPV